MGIFSKFFQSDKHRVEALRSKAATMEMKFHLEDSHMLADQLSEFKLFNQGTSRKVKSVMTKSDGLESEFLFDYSYTIQAGNTRVKHNQTVLFLNSKKLSLPEFILKPENFFDKIISAFGYTDINFESHQEFSKKYNLKGEYEPLIRKYFNKSVLDLLTEHRDFTIEGMNYYFIFYKSKLLTNPNDIASFYQLGKMISELFTLQSELDKDFLQNFLKDTVSN
jgi:hypothetical protein